MATHADAVPMLSDAVLMMLAAGPLPYLRTSRSLCQERSIAIADLSDSDGSAIRRIYEMLGHLDPPDSGDEGTSGEPTRVSAGDCAELRTLFGSLGQQHDYAGGSFAREVLHDVRSGASGALISALGWASSSLDALFSVRLLARDHRKLMRSAVRDLDPPRRARDLTFRPHSVAQLLSGLRASGSLREGVSLAVDCRFEGMVSACCVELGTLERVLYNMANNALRHASHGRVGVWLLPVASGGGQDVRIVVANFVAAADAQVLRQLFGSDLSPLFEGSFSSTGSGIGLHTCAELVADAYGLACAAAAVDGGHVGARIIEDAFVAWFHWPALGARDA